MRRKSQLNQLVQKAHKGVEALVRLSKHALTHAGAHVPGDHLTKPFSVGAQLTEVL